MGWDDDDDDGDDAAAAAAAAAAADDDDDDADADGDGNGDCDGDEIIHDLQVILQLLLRPQDRAARGNEIPVFHALAQARLANLELHLETLGQLDQLGFAPRVAPSAASLLHY